MGWLTKKYPVEALLRPAVEFNSAFIALLFAVVLYFAPGLILMTPVVAHSAALLLLILAVIRFYQGWRIVHYKRGLKKLPYYSMDGNHVPVSHRKLFLGKGFRWRQKHVERLREIYRDDADQYLSPSALYRFARWLELRFEYTPLLKNIIGLFSWNTFLNPVRPLPPVGGSPEIHAVGMFEGESNITMDWYINPPKMTISVVLSDFMTRRASQGMVAPFARSATTAWRQTGQPFGHFCDDLPLRYSA